MTDKFYIEFGSKEEYDAYLADKGADRKKLGEIISASLAGESSYKFFGFCCACDAPSVFHSDWVSSYAGLINFRERLVCCQCGLNSRQRFIKYYAEKLINENNFKDIYIYEMVTPFYTSFEESLNKIGVSLTGSEYLGYDKVSGSFHQGVRHEDAMNFSFADNIFDMLISQDVYEHVPDFEKSLAESARILKPNGCIVFTVPFAKKAITERRAVFREDMTLEYLKPEVYHGNPVDSKGSLVFYDLGWDMVEMFAEHGFELNLVSYWDMNYAHIGLDDQICFVARKMPSK